MTIVRAGTLIVEIIKIPRTIMSIVLVFGARLEYLSRRLAYQFRLSLSLETPIRIDISLFLEGYLF